MVTDQIYHKDLKVIASCNTRTQVQAAYNYVELASKQIIDFEQRCELKRCINRRLFNMRIGR